MTAIGHLVSEVAPATILAPHEGTRWFVTSTPFDGTFTAQLDTGDRFTYPASHASAGETYIWNGLAWVFERIITKPTAATVMVVGGETP